MSYLNMICDSCGRGVQGITWVNGMKFCAKCYQETFGASKDWQLLDKDKTIVEQQKRIADLEEQLKNAIVPKFKVGDKCWAIRNATNIYNEPKQVLIKEITIAKNCIKYYAKNGCLTNGTNKTTMHIQSQLFTTKEEAEAKLKELKGENK